MSCALAGRAKRAPSSVTAHEITRVLIVFIRYLLNFLNVLWQASYSSQGGYLSGDVCRSLARQLRRETWSKSRACFRERTVATNLAGSLRAQRRCRPTHRVDSRLQVPTRHVLDTIGWPD